MSNEVHVILFNRSLFRFEMRFEGDEWETATVKMSLMSNSHGMLSESVALPVKALFDLSYLAEVAIRRTALQYETEVQEMHDRLVLKKHPFGDRKEKNVKEDKA